MGLSPRVVAVLLCLLACTGNSTHGCDGRALKEIIHILNQVTEKGTPCTDRMNVSDVFTERENTTERELICKASQVLRKFYNPHDEILCLKNNPRLHKDLKRLIRSISGLLPSPRGWTLDPLMGPREEETTG
uniref:interleukin-4 isoform X2 n=1 Tax=Myodes glareolus TaxID=447135 RepID=UPI00202288F6|nr:interleukin-4 isoform X2 [Myodes glareolus]